MPLTRLRHFIHHSIEFATLVTFDTLSDIWLAYWNSSCILVSLLNTRESTIMSTVPRHVALLTLQMKRWTMCGVHRILWPVHCFWAIRYWDKSSWRILLFLWIPCILLSLVLYCIGTTPFKFSTFDDHIICLCFRCLSHVLVGGASYSGFHLVVIFVKSCIWWSCKVLHLVIGRSHNNRPCLYAVPWI